MSTQNYSITKVNFFYWFSTNPPQNGILFHVSCIIISQSTHITSHFCHQPLILTFSTPLHWSNVCMKLGVEAKHGISKEDVARLSSVWITRDAIKWHFCEMKQFVQRLVSPCRGSVSLANRFLMTLLRTVESAKKSNFSSAAPI